MNSAINEKYAVLVVDLQNAMFDGVVVPPVQNADEIVDRVNLLRTWANQTRSPVCFVRHDGEGPLAAGADGWPVWSALNQQLDEPTFSKQVGDAFSQPLLTDWIKQHAVTDVVIVGAQSEFCIAATVKGALNRGFAVTVLSDAHTTWDTPGHTAVEIIAAQNIEFSRAGARVADIDDFINTLTSK